MMEQSTCRSHVYSASLVQLCAKVTPTSQSFFLSTLDVVPYLCLLLDSLYRRQPDPTY